MKKQALEEMKIKKKKKITRNHKNPQVASYWA